jgi:hypothetical protein
MDTVAANRQRARRLARPPARTRTDTQRTPACRRSPGRQRSSLGWLRVTREKLCLPGSRSSGSRRLAGSSIDGHCILQIIRGPRRRGLLPGVIGGNEAPHCQGAGDKWWSTCSGPHAWPLRDPSAAARSLLISGYRLGLGCACGAWRALHRGRWAIEIQEQAVRRTVCSGPIPSAICPGTTLLPRHQRRALERKRPENPDDDSFLTGPALMLDLLAVWR